jgi:DNA-3-methyladenine glycosylase
MTILSSTFFDRSPLDVAPQLLGKILVRRLDGLTISGRIVEVEAYLAGDDPASHAYQGMTKRNTSLYKSAGHAYIYRIHTQHCLDLVTEKVNVPTSVLIRALEPIEGIDIMQKLRGRKKLTDLTTGPGKICQALSLTKVLDGIDVTSPNSPLTVCDDGSQPEHITKSTRIGISKAKEMELRFLIADSPFISKRVPSQT